MSLKLKGTIQVKPKLMHGDQECLGITKVIGKQFTIKLSKKAMVDGPTFAETILHELLHLYFFVLQAFQMLEVSERKQHKFIDFVVPLLFKRLTKFLKIGE